MYLIRLSIAHLRTQPLTTLLNVILLALGVASIVLIILFAAQWQERLLRDGKGIDMVVSGKGSPLQIILSSVYHADVPTGNIPLAKAQEIAAHPMVGKTIPLALGDNFAGYRIVGTEHSYIKHYQAKLATGRLWQENFEVVIGATVARATGLGIGDRFYGTHGLREQGHLHDKHPYTVVGILAPHRSVIDRLILGSLASVWEVHNMPYAHPLHPQRVLTEDYDREQSHTQTEITALLVSYATPLAAVSLVREINTHTNLQAASVPIESARIVNLVGMGIQTIKGFALIIIVCAALSIFVALYNALQTRYRDVAILRSLGARRRDIFMLTILEAQWITLLGLLLGLASGHIAASWLGSSVPALHTIGLTGWDWRFEHWYLVSATMLIGLFASLLPAIQSYKINITEGLFRH